MNTTEKTEEMAALEKAASVFGGYTKLAEALNSTLKTPISLSTPGMWKMRGRVPAEYCPTIEHETSKAGEPVTCEELLPSVNWAVLRSTPKRRTKKEVACE